MCHLIPKLITVQLKNKHIEPENFYLQFTQQILEVKNFPQDPADIYGIFQQWKQISSSQYIIQIFKCASKQILDVCLEE